METNYNTLFYNPPLEEGPWRDLEKGINQAQILVDESHVSKYGNWTDTTAEVFHKINGIVIRQGFTSLQPIIIAPTLNRMLWLGRPSPATIPRTWIKTLFSTAEVLYYDSYRPINGRHMEKQLAKEYRSEAGKVLIACATIVKQQLSTDKDLETFIL
jgi:hypothetical protein